MGSPQHHLGPQEIGGGIWGEGDTQGLPPGKSRGRAFVGAHAPTPILEKDPPPIWREA